MSVRKVLFVSSRQLRFVSLRQLSFVSSRLLFLVLTLRGFLQLIPLVGWLVVSGSERGGKRASERGGEVRGVVALSTSRLGEEEEGTHDGARPRSFVPSLLSSQTPRCLLLFAPHLPLLASDEINVPIVSRSADPLAAGRHKRELNENRCRRAMSMAFSFFALSFLSLAHARAGEPPADLPCAGKAQALRLLGLRGSARARE